jgi:hypothetical protein
MGMNDNRWTSVNGHQWTDVYGRMEKTRTLKSDVKSGRQNWMSKLDRWN